MESKRQNIDPPHDLLVFQVTREVTNLSKNFLIILEDLRDNDKTITDDEYLNLRKKCLDLNGAVIRNLTAFLDRFEVKL